MSAQINKNKMLKKLTRITGAPELRGDLSKIHGDMTGLSGTVSSSLRGDVSGIRGDISCYLFGDVTGLSGDVTGLTGWATGLTGNLDDCKLTAKNRQVGIDVSDITKTI